MRGVWCAEVGQLLGTASTHMVIIISEHADIEQAVHATNRH